MSATTKTDDKGTGAPLFGVSLKSTSLHVAGVELTVLRGGSGPSVLLCHDEWGIAPRDPFADILAERSALAVPIAPGFERTDAVDELGGVRDLARLFLATIRALDIRPVLVGCSFGAWVALEMATMCEDRLAGLALVGPVGLRFGEPTVRNFVDLFAHSDADLASLCYHDPHNAPHVGPESPEEVLVSYAKSREATARYAWEPYLHTPGLDRWTRELRLPVSLIYGEDDRFVMEGYYDHFAASLRQPTIMAIPQAGHLAHRDAPADVAEAVFAMLG